MGNLEQNTQAPNIKIAIYKMAQYNA